ncbi:unnamed protein product, partial [Closterium sp. Naga37s-1]
RQSIFLSTSILLPSSHPFSRHPAGVPQWASRARGTWSRRSRSPSPWSSAARSSAPTSTR